MIKLFRIVGDSLYPLYKEGELVIAMRPKYGLLVKPHDIVTFTCKGVGVMIKRVRSVENTQVFVEGTSPNSVDSRVFGTIPLSEISYKILFKIPFL
jgi:type IV secretory pathway protease TraF